MKQFAYMFATMILVCGLIFLVKSCEVRRLEKTITAYEAALDSCLNAEPTRDTLWLFRTVKDTVRLNFTYTVKDTITADAVVPFGDDFGLEVREYTGTYKTDYLAIRWRALVYGELKEVQILPTSTYRYPQITLTRSVPVPTRTPVTTGFKERSHLYMTGGIGYYKANDMLFNIGLLWIHKRGWGLQPTITLNNEGHFYYGGNLIFRVTK